MSELLPCPFCGGACGYRSRHHDGSMSSGMETKWQTVGCPVCDIWLPEIGGGENPYNVSRYHVAENREKLEKAWNTRATDNTADQIAELESKLADAERKCDELAMKTLSPDADRLVNVYTAKYKELERKLDAAEKDRDQYALQFRISADRYHDCCGKLAAEYERGRKDQREADAALAETRVFMSDYIYDATTCEKIAKAIRNQEIK